MPDLPVPAPPSAVDEDPFDRYKRASKSHQALLASRGRIRDDRELTTRQSERLDRIDVALGLAVVELEAARDGYLYEPVGRPPTPPTIDESR